MTVKRMIAACAAGLLASALVGCSGGGISSLTGNAVSETDRMFLSAAGSWDRNKDSSVTCDEWKAYATELFDGADANGDQAVDKAEWPKVIAVDRMFDTVNHGYYDANSDGKVTRPEFVDRPNRAFQLLDKQNTCVLNSAVVAGARSNSQFDVDDKPRQSGDPREQKIPGVKQ